MYTNAHWPQRDNFRHFSIDRKVDDIAGLWLVDIFILIDTDKKDGFILMHGSQTAFMSVDLFWLSSRVITGTEDDLPHLWGRQVFPERPVGNSGTAASPSAQQAWVSLSLSLSLSLCIFLQKNLARCLMISFCLNCHRHRNWSDHKSFKL